MSQSRLALIIAGAVALLVSSSAVLALPGQDGKYGAGVSELEATPIAELYARPAEFVGKTIRVEGVVTEVCTDMGCWMALAPESGSDKTVRVKVDDGAGIVFPVTARGRRASAEGVFEKIAADDAEGKNAATEQGATGEGAAFNAAYQIKATGAVVR